MGTFVRVTLVIAAVMVAFAALVMLVKLLVLAAVIAAAAIAIAFTVRALRGRLGANRSARVTALTARR